MTRVVTERVVDGATADGALQSRDGFVTERALGGGRFEAVSGPVRDYRRVARAEHLPDGRVVVTQTVDYRLAVPYFAFVFYFPVRALLRSLGREGVEPRWWRALSPGEHFDARSAHVLATLCAAAVITGYLNTLLSQTLTFAADEFDAGKTAQGTTAFAVRIGGMLAFALIAMADRRGRRPIILGLLTFGCVTAATGAIAPSLPWLAVSQFVARAMSTALVGLIPVAAAEEMPAGTRAWATSLLALAGGLGAGVCVLSLPLADLSTGGWRIIYALPLLGLFLVPGIARRLPESRRFERPHVDVGLASHSGRFWLLAVSLFLSNLLIAPASVFGNRYLDEELGFSAARISLFAVLTATPGRDWCHGRRPPRRCARPTSHRRALSTGVGGLLTASLFFVSGAPLWCLAVVASIINGLAVPALAVYGPELFPTSLRGRANGLILSCGLAGSGVGLLVAGVWSDAIGRLGPPIAALSIGQLAVAALVLARYPETAQLELEELNPEDA